MSPQSAGFIGAGRVARIILGGWKHAGKIPPRVVLYDADPSLPEDMQSIGPEVAPTNSVEEAAASDVVFLAVHPPVMKDAAEAVKPHLKADAVVVSLAPKFTIANLSEMLGGFKRLVRMIPNAPSIIGRGYNPAAFAEALSEAPEKQALREMLEPLGDCPEVDEKHLEAYAVLSAMGPTYLWPQMYALLSLGEAFGLSREAAEEALDKMLWGAMAAVKESGLSQEQVQDLIPVKPMAGEVQVLCEAYERKLKGLIEKIRP